MAREEDTGSRHSDVEDRRREVSVCQSATGDDRTGALVNGALIVIGTLGVVDNLVAHWLLGLHRAVPGPWATEVEVALVTLSLGLLLVGFMREIRVRRSRRQVEEPTR